MIRIHLIADMLDTQLQDAKGENAGRVDGIIIELQDDAAPRLTFIEVSPITLLGRFSERLAKWYASVDRRFGAERGKPTRIPWNRIFREKLVIKLDVDADETPINAVDEWLRRKIVGRIPGS